MSHVCDLSRPWPIGHPLPPEDPAKLQGPEVGDRVTYVRVRRWTTHDDGVQVKHEQTMWLPAVIKARSYVWSPGECRSGGGYRRYDWKVIDVEEPPSVDHPYGRTYTVVVDDKDLITASREAL